ncbi:MAG: hypothetical protein IPK13_10430 [Deltaproteobacteria bacterium]|nr:hypothetical protein [Deltaproteobacteria bacterium]
MKLPESLYFLRPGWWVVHVASVGLVFAAGFFASHHLAEHDEHAHGGAPDADHHASGQHDHTSPEVLRPLMQQMLVDSVQLQGALSEGDMARAATHADAIAGACEDGGETDHEVLPARLGPSFLEHDRKLHGSASRLGEALRADRRDEARSIGQKLVSACQSCHAQAPAASRVDLRVLTSFADTLVNPQGATP